MLVDLASAPGCGQDVEQLLLADAGGAPRGGSQRQHRACLGPEQPVRQVVPRLEGGGEVLAQLGAQLVPVVLPGPRGMMLGACQFLDRRCLLRAAGQWAVPGAVHPDDVRQQLRVALVILLLGWAEPAAIPGHDGRIEHDHGLPLAHQLGDQQPAVGFDYHWNLATAVAVAGGVEAPKQVKEFGDTVGGLGDPRAGDDLTCPVHHSDVIQLLRPVDPAPPPRHR
nr:hypothetical protein [Streptomyces sp. MP131-18]